MGGRGGKGKGRRIEGGVACKVDVLFQGIFFPPFVFSFFFLPHLFFFPSIPGIKPFGCILNFVILGVKNRKKKKARGKEKEKISGWEEGKKKWGRKWKNKKQENVKKGEKWKKWKKWIE